MREFNPFLCISRTPVAKVVPVNLKPFVPKVTGQILRMEGYIIDLDFIDNSLKVLYNDGSLVVVHGIGKKNAIAFLEDEARRFFNEQ